MKYYLENIKKRRLELSLNQEQVAKKLNCDYSTYGKIEKGQSALSVDRLIILSEILNISISELLNDKKIKIDKSNKRYKVLVEIDLTGEEFAKTGLHKKIIT